MFESSCSYLSFPLKYVAHTFQIMFTLSICCITVLGNLSNFPTDRAGIAYRFTVTLSTCYQDEKTRLQEGHSGKQDCQVFTIELKDTKQ